MRILLLIMAFLSIPQLSDASINESKMVEPFLDIFNGKVQRDGFVKVPVTTFNSNGELRKNGDKKMLDPQKYETLKTWASPVFRMQPSPKPSEEPRKGTVFHIGNNLVLTNQHVLDPERKNLTKCEDFRVMEQDGSVYPCKRVIFCDNDHDICLIEMAPKSKTCLGRCKEEAEKLEDNSSIKMRASYTPSEDQSQKVIVTAVGNSMGLGIHVSQGLGVVLKKDTIHFHASATKGNSGGVILDEDGIMIGLVKQQSPLPEKNKSVINPVGNDTYNIALRVEKVVELCRAALKNEPKTLEKFNQSVLE